SFVVIAIRDHHPGGSTSNLPASAPSAQSVFELPYTRRVRSAEFRLVHKGDGGTWSGSGVIEFAPEHAFSETLRGGGGVFERDVEVGGVAYQEAFGSRYQITEYELNDFSFIHWDGGAPPDQLELSAQTTFDGQPAWVLKQAYGSSKWIVGKHTGDPLEAVIDGSDIYTFSHWGQAPAIQAPAAGDVSTGRYSGSGSAAVVAPAATVRVLKEKAVAGVGDPAGFRTVALLISYKNTSAASNFDNSMSLVSSDGVFASAEYSELRPSLKPGTRVARGRRIVGWDEFVVPRQATSFHLLFGEQLDQMNSTPRLDYLISIAVQAPA
ncbi:MAG: hypothetical protein J2P38_07800, partial [Candidatus Dormibacteraeota bacterium]|nr:hypothetical protein [Candidatus Dormibacteraeota bacterium]